MGATDLRDFIGLRPGSQRLSKNSPLAWLIIILVYWKYTVVLTTLNYSYLFPRTSPLSVISYRVTLRGTDQRNVRSQVSAQLHCELAYYMPGLYVTRDFWSWLTASSFLSVSFNLAMWDTGRLGGLLPNADSEVPCPQFGCKLKSSRSKFLACIFVMINLILSFSIFELSFALFT